MRDIINANKAVRKMKATNLHLKFPDLGNYKSLRVIAYADAAHANLTSGVSQGAIIVFLAGEGDQIAPIIWQSKKLKKVPKSPFAAETLVQAEGGYTGVLVAMMAKEIFNVESVKVECITDSKSLIDNLESTRIVEDSKDSSRHCKTEGDDRDRRD